MNRTTNQQNPPLPKKKRVDSKGNDARRIFVKSGTATLELAKMPSENAANIFIQKMIENAKLLGGSVSCNHKILR